MPKIRGIDYQQLEDAINKVGVNTDTNEAALTIVAPADSVATGTTSANATTTIAGSGTTFLTEIGVGDRISLSSAAGTFATVLAIASNTSLTVDTALGNGTSQTINIKKGIVRADTTASASVATMINDQGQMLIGTASAKDANITTPSSAILQTRVTGGNNFSGFRYTNDANPPVAALFKSRSATLGTGSVVTTGDLVARFQGNAIGTDGASYVSVARVTMAAEGTIASGAVPGNIRLETANSAGTSIEAMRIDSTQNVGIGITPLYRLHVAQATATGANAAFRASDLSANSRTIFGNSAGDLVIGTDTSGNGIVYSDTSKTLAFGTNGSATAKVLISTAGEVGIGTTPTSGQNLHIKTAANTQFRLETTLGGGGLLITMVNPSVRNWMIASNQNLGSTLEFTPSTALGGVSFTTPAMVIDGNFNAGIGQSNPTSSNVVRFLHMANATSAGIVYENTTATAQRYSSYVSSGKSFVVCQDETAGTARIVVAQTTGVTTFTNNIITSGGIKSADDIQFTSSTTDTNRLFWLNGATRFAQIAIAVGSNDMITGSVTNDLCVRANNTSIRLSPDNGATTALRLDAADNSATFTGTIDASSSLSNGNQSISSRNTNATSGSNCSFKLQNDANRQAYFQYASSGGIGASQLTGGPSGEVAQLYTVSNKSLVIGTNGTAAIIIDGVTQNVGVGVSPTVRFDVSKSTTSDAFIARIKNADTSTSSDAIPALDIVKGSTTNTAGTNRFIEFDINAGATGSGYASSNGANSVAFFNSSDRRMKEDIVDLDGGLDIIMALQPRSFKWKETEQECVGFIAQELAEVLPHQVHATDDGEGSELPEGQEPWAMTEAGMVPYLVKALQELKAEFDAYVASHP